MKRQSYLEKLEQAWQELMDACQGLTDEQMLQPGVTGEWSVKDILAHVSTWEGESLKHLPLILAGERPPRYSQLYGGIDAFNAMSSAAWQARPLAEVRLQLEDTHRRLLAYLQSIPEAQLATETRFRRRLGWDSTRHYPLHAQAIRAWRERNA